MDELSKCLACGELDTIYHTNDCGYCTECGTPENYTTVLIDENGNENYMKNFNIGDNNG